MKKFFVLTLLSLVCMVSNAQLVKGTSYYKEKSPSHIWIDLGVGGTSGDWEDGAVLNLGLRYNMPFSDNFSWDIIKVNLQSNTEEIGDCLTLQALTGLRGTTPVLFGSNGSIYANAALGYGYMFDPSEGGFTWEIGAGVNITSRFAIGIVYGSQSIDMGEYEGYDSGSANLGHISGRLSFTF